MLSKNVYDELVIKSMLSIQKASGLVTKTQYDLDKQGLEKRI